MVILSYIHFYRLSQSSGRIRTELPRSMLYNVDTGFACQILFQARAWPFSVSDYYLSFDGASQLPYAIIVPYETPNRCAAACRKDLSLSASISGTVLFYAYHLASEYLLGHFVYARRGMPYYHFYSDKTSLSRKTCSISSFQMKHASTFHRTHIGRLTIWLSKLPFRNCK